MCSYGLETDESGCLGV
ncbi:hypothetical protein DNH61_18380 [Paenibacillus sambharensis]|uniref:Uncharacterized protein n=1 Tax=Paenibacillus sambharensis TaxID=1803190 RepID=A0A2W1LHR6_9BACL|nr:hypothetical protein DNH61_18380 [Paenibacillus sambharensis]